MKIGRNILEQALKGQRYKSFNQKMDETNCEDKNMPF